MHTWFVDLDEVVDLWNWWYAWHLNDVLLQDVAMMEPSFSIPRRNVSEYLHGRQKNVHHLVYQ